MRPLRSVERGESVGRSEGPRSRFLVRSLGASLLLLTALLWLRWVPEAQAYIPPADRTLRAIAEVNRASGRSKAIQLELTMRIGENAPIASGQ